LQKCKDAKLKAVRDSYSVLGSLVAINKIISWVVAFLLQKIPPDFLLNKKRSAMDACFEV
jgi:hypothetical protein